MTRKKPLTTQQFEACLRLIDSDAKLFDRYTATYDEWRVGQMLCSGMKHRRLGCPHGIVRKIDVTNQAVYEASYYQGQLHGLYRGFFVDRVCYGLFDEGKRLAYLSYANGHTYQKSENTNKNQIEAQLLNILGNQARDQKPASNSD